jgi:hypothetical protein
MWDTIHVIVDALLPLLPSITIGVRFLTALIGLGLAIHAVTRRIRRRRRNRS